MFCGVMADPLSVKYIFLIISFAGVTSFYLHIDSRRRGLVQTIFAGSAVLEAKWMLT